MLRVLADALAEAEHTRARTKKTDALAAAFAAIATADPAHLPLAVRLVTGSLLPGDDARALGAGGRLVFDAACAVCGESAAALGALTGRAGDLGTALEEALRARTRSEAPARSGEPRARSDGPHARSEEPRARDEASPSPPPRASNPDALTLADVARMASALATSSARADKLAALTDALTRATPTEARYLVRAVLGEMRVGARVGVVEDAIAKAFGRSPSAVRRAAGFETDVGELARLAAGDRLGDARPVLGRPLGFMLATPIEVAGGLSHEARYAIEDKIDGIRAQAHVTPDGVALFARGTGPVTAAFPDVTEPLVAAARDGALPPAIVDGELVVVAADGRPRPFSAIQPRLKKLAPSPELLQELPVFYLAYDLLWEDGASLVDLSFDERRARLDAWARKAPAPLVLHDSRTLDEGGATEREATVEAEYAAARARGHEGLVIKRLDAPYAPGVRGSAWLKVKKALATLDVVVVAAERGHGKRAGVLSDYTFAVRDGDALLTVGKAYSGLTDEEIRSMTARLLAIATAEERRGYLAVRPEIVLEIAFDGVQRSDRHSSGFALRFPRIQGVRDDKTPQDADTIDDVRALWESQLATGHREDVRRNRARTRGASRPRKPKAQLSLFEDD